MARMGIYGILRSAFGRIAMRQTTYRTSAHRVLRVRHKHVHVYHATVELLSGSVPYLLR